MSKDVQIFLIKYMIYIISVVKIIMIKIDNIRINVYQDKYDRRDIIIFNLDALFS